MKKKYRALRIISSIYKAGGILVLGGTLLVIMGYFLFAINANFGVEVGGVRYHFYSVGDAFVDSVKALFVGGPVALGLYGAGEVFLLFIDMEENTRITRSAMLQVAKQAASSSGGRDRSVPISSGSSMLSRVRQDLEQN